MHIMELWVMEPFEDFCNINVIMDILKDLC